MLLHVGGQKYLLIFGFITSLRFYFAKSDVINALLTLHPITAKMSDRHILQPNS